MANNQKILIVDDEPFNVEYLEQELEETGCQLLTAFDGEEAIRRVRSELPDLVLLDIMMPKMDGFSVLGVLKSDPVTREIPVIVISASNDMRSVVKGIQMGAEDFLPKPFDPTLLFARISSSLEKKRLRDIETLYLKSLEHEFEIARDIQLSFLPAELPVLPRYAVEAFLKAAREVAGDFYDVFMLPDGNLALVVGDVCGKGIGAALFMTLFRSLIRATSTSAGISRRSDLPSLSPADRLKHVITFTNEYIAEVHAEANMFATVFAGILDVQGNTLHYINCGNEPPLLIRSGRVVATLPPTGAVIGIIPGTRFEVGEIAIEPGDTLLAFTDGLTDSKNANDEFFGNARLIETLQTLAPASRVLLTDVYQSLLEFIGKSNQFDDITMLSLFREV